MPRRRPFRVRRRFAPLAFGLYMAIAQSAAATSAEEKAQAEALFDEGLKLMKEGRFELACPKLEQSERIDPGIGTLLYLGECYERTGRTASAWATFREAASSAQAAGQADRASKGQERAKLLEGSLSRLTIEAGAESRDIPELTVKRAGKPLEPSLWGVALPIDPGKYQIEVSAPGYESWSASVTVTPQASSQTVKIPALKKLTQASAPAMEEPHDPAPVPVEPQPKPDAASSGLSTQQTIGVVVGGVGIIGLGIGSFFGVTAISKNSDAELLCQRGRQCDSPRGVTLTEEAKDAAVASNIAFGAGAGLLATGMILYLTGGSTKASTALNVAPMFGPRSAALQVGGAFE